MSKSTARPLAELEQILADPGRVGNLQRNGQWTRTSMEFLAAKHREQPDNPHAGAEALEALQLAEQSALRGGVRNSRLNLGAGASTAHNGIPALAPSQDTVDKLWAGVQASESLRISNAVIATDDIGADEHSQPLAYRAREPRRLVTAAGISSQSVSGVESVDFPVFGAGAAGITAEGSSKTEYDAITPDSATPQMINIWTDYTRQAALTQSTFESRLRTVLASKVAIREDKLLIDTVLGNSEILTEEEDSIGPDDVLEAATTVAAGEVAAEPNLMIFNPADTADLFGADAFGSNSVSDSRQLNLSLHGLVGYPSNHISAGNVLVGAWGAGSRFIVGLPPTYLIDATSGIKTNKITLLLEEAVGLALDEPTAFLHIHPS